MELPVSSEPPKKNSIPFSISLIIVALVAAGVFWSFGYFKKTPAEKNTAEKEMPAWAKELKGKVYMTLVGKNNTKSGLQLFAVDLGLLEKKPQQILTDDAYNISQYISPDGLSSIYSRLKKGETVAQIYKLDLKTGEKQPITQSQSLRKRNAEWSSDGQTIAFMAETGMEAVKEGESDLKNWSVFVTDLRGKEQLISAGAAYPQWLPDNKRLIISKEDGLYLCFLANIKCERVVDNLSPYSKTSLNMKIDLSRDGKMIAYSNYEVGEIILIKILSLDPFQAEVYKVIKSTAFWPIFSEDGQYLMAEEIIDPEIPNDKILPQIVVYKLETMEKATLLSLDEFKQDAMFVTDWRY